MEKLTDRVRKLKAKVATASEGTKRRRKREKRLTAAEQSQERLDAAMEALAPLEIPPKAAQYAGFTRAEGPDDGSVALFVNAQRRTALRVGDGKKGRVKLIPMREGLMEVVEVPGTMLSREDWFRTDYDVQRAARMYADAARWRGITEEARLHLERILDAPLVISLVQSTNRSNVMTETPVTETNANTPIAAAATTTAAPKGKASKKKTAAPKAVSKKTAKKTAAPATKSTSKKTAAAAPSKGDRQRASKFTDKTIKGLVKNAAATKLRPGSIRAAFLDFVLKAKNTNDVLGKTVKVKGKLHEITAVNLKGMVARKHIALS